MTTLDYVGTELGLFAQAANWKAYVGQVLRPFIGGRVLDVGAGLGSNIGHLLHDGVSEWTALEPDPALAAEIPDHAPAGVTGRLRVLTGTLGTVPDGSRFDAILYLDVLEHIEDDAGELRRAAGRLAPGGRLVVLAPAHQALFSPFDAAIGHFRRYSLRELRTLTPPRCQVAKAVLLDSVGLFASLANRLVLRSAMPTPKQIATWDRAIIPVSRLVDPLTRHRFGKSAVMIWQAAG